MEKTSGIYKIINKTNGKYYVGSTTQLDDSHGRWYKHQRSLIKGNHINSHLQSAWKKYGQDNFDFIILEKTDKKNLLVVEQKYLDIAKGEQDKCYNQNFLVSGTNFSLDVIKRRTKSFKKYYSIHPNPMSGKKHSDESKEKMRQKALGRKLSDETKKKLSQYRGIKSSFSDKTIYLISNPTTGETFQGLRSDFLRDRDISSGLFLWARKKNKPCKGWIIRLSEKV